MNRTLKKLAIVAGSALPAAAILIGSASAAVSPNNRVENGDFAGGTAHWTASAAPSPTAALKAGFGVLKVTNTKVATNITQANAYQCIPLTGGLPYTLSGKMQILTNQNRSGQANMQIMLFSDAHCSDMESFHDTTAVTQVGVWQKQTLKFQAPTTVKSAMVKLQVRKNATQLLQKGSDPFSVYFDDVEVLSHIVKLPGGPIVVGNPTPPPADPEEPQDTPDPAPQPGNPQDPQQPEDQDEPAEEPEVEEGETVEETVPGPDLPGEEDEPSNEGEDTPADSNTGTETAGEDTASDGATKDDVSAQGEDVQTLGETEEKTPSKPSKGSSKNTGNPTPAAPEAGNASIADKGLIGTTELAVIGAGALAIMGAAFMVASRRRKPAADDDYSSDY